MSKTKYLYPHPNKPGVMVSRQRIWQLKREAQGVCRYCSGKVHKNGKCYKHWAITTVANREYQRRKGGWKRRYNSMSYHLKQRAS